MKSFLFQVFHCLWIRPRLCLSLDLPSTCFKKTLTKRSRSIAPCALHQVLKLFPRWLCWWACHLGRLQWQSLGQGILFPSCPVKLHQGVTEGCCCSLVIVVSRRRWFPGGWWPCWAGVSRVGWGWKETWARNTDKGTAGICLFVYWRGLNLFLNSIVDCRQSENQCSETQRLKS